jgi:hypothetical protein
LLAPLGSSHSLQPWASNRAETSSALTGYLNKANVSVPFTGSPFGNAQRNMVVSYVFFQTDLGLHKAFPLWNNASSFDFRAEAFNVLNKVNYQAPDGNVSNSTCGLARMRAPNRLGRMTRRDVTVHYRAGRKC